jgi:NADH:ubiquinone oxidoreductase subunit C
MVFYFFIKFKVEIKDIILKKEELSIEVEILNSKLLISNSEKEELSIEVENLKTKMINTANVLKENGYDLKYILDLTGIDLSENK